MDLREQIVARAEEVFARLEQFEEIGNEWIKEIRVLSVLGRGLCFPRVRVLSEGAAEELARQRGRFLELGLGVVSEGVAAKLAGRGGVLRLPRLEEVSEGAARELARHEGKLVLGMERISEAAALEIAGHRGVLLVEGCVEVEEAIGRHRELYPLVEVAGGRLPEGSEFEGEVVGDFRIGKYPVTFREWKRVVEWSEGRGYDLVGVGVGSGGDHPVRNVSWYDAVKWCNARSEKEGKTAMYEVEGEVYRRGELGREGSFGVEMRRGADGYRLPREVEWEWAARGGLETRGYVYSGSDELDEVGWYGDNSAGAVEDLGGGRGTWGVGEKRGNELGLYDMSGNVWEWCRDEDYSEFCRSRGGSWRFTAGFCTVGNRYDMTPNIRSTILGLRVVLSSVP
jgi:formylglycine-generating enzyme required for sulfatase activity